jgi:hypothetical protein
MRCNCYGGTRVPQFKALAPELEKLLKQCDALRVKRNDTVHALWAIFMGPHAPKVVDAGAGEVTGMVIKARGRLNIKINHMTVSQIDDRSNGRGKEDLERGASRIGKTDSRRRRRDSDQLDVRPFRVPMGMP